jgi:hypothetical protein
MRVPGTRYHPRNKNTMAHVSHRPRSSTKEKIIITSSSRNETTLLARHDVHVPASLLLSLDRALLGASGGRPTEQVVETAGVAERA